MTKRGTDADTATLLLGIVADVLGGARHSRRTIAARTGRSLPTADRWIEQIASTVPNFRKHREGKTTWLVYDGRSRPTKTAAVGACIAASLASLFEGSQQERNLRDARDYLLRVRGESYGDLDRKFFLAPKGGEYALPEKRQDLDEIVDALLTDRFLRFAYEHNDRSREEPTVAPLSLVIFDHQFYVLARRQDSSLYAYRFARMSEIDAQHGTFSYPSRNEFDPRALFGSIFGIHVSSTGPVEDVEVVLSNPWGTYAMSHRWHPTQQVMRIDDDQVRVTLRVRLCREIETWVLSFGEHARVVGPEGLRSVVAARLARAAAIYEVRRPIAKAGTARATSTTARARAGNARRAP